MFAKKCSFVNAFVFGCCMSFFCNNLKAQNLDMAIDELNSKSKTIEEYKNLKKNEQGYCARAVYNALKAGGYDVKKMNANDYKSYLNNHNQFNKINETNYKPRKGDISVMDPYPGGSQQGHIAMYNGKDWVSQFKQKDIYANRDYRKYNPENVIFRPKTKDIQDGVKLRNNLGANSAYENGSLAANENLNKPPGKMYFFDSEKGYRNNMGATSSVGTNSTRTAMMGWSPKWGKPVAKTDTSGSSVGTNSIRTTMLAALARPTFGFGKPVAKTDTSGRADTNPNWGTMGYRTADSQSRNNFSVGANGAINWNQNQVGPKGSSSSMSVNPNRGTVGYRTADSQSRNAVTLNPNGLAASRSETGTKGTSSQGIRIGPNGANISHSTQNSKSTTTFSAGIQGKTVSLGTSVSTSKGNKYGGGAWTDGKGNGGLSGSYNGVGGSIGQQKGTTVVGASYATVGPYGVRMVNYGNVNLNGRNSSISGGTEIYDPTGLIRLGGANATLDRRQYNQSADIGMGNVRATTEANLRFQGVKSDFSVQQGANWRGVGSYTQGGMANYKGVNAGANVNIAGAKVGANAGVKFKGVNTKANVQINTFGIKNSFDTAQFASSFKKGASSAGKEVTRTTTNIKNQVGALNPTKWKMPKVKMPKPFG